MSASPSTTLRRAATAAAAVAAFHAFPALAQNPAPATTPAQPMTCDSACHARMGHGPAAPGQPAQMGGMGMGGMQGGMMMCPMMGHMQGMGGMGGMQGQGGMMGMGMRHGQQGMAGMAGMGPTPQAPDTAAMRQVADHHAMMTRAYYDALVRRGFSAAQALQIVAAQGMPGPGR